MADATRIEESKIRESERYSRNIGLVISAQGGDEGAMERLVIENTGLVRSIALKFRDRGTELEDLMQIGTMGMIKAMCTSRRQVN